MNLLIVTLPSLWLGALSLRISISESLGIKSYSVNSSNLMITMYLPSISGASRAETRTLTYQGHAQKAQHRPPIASPSLSGGFHFRSHRRLMDSCQLWCHTLRGTGPVINVIPTDALARWFAKSLKLLTGWDVSSRQSSSLILWLPWLPWHSPTGQPRHDCILTMTETFRSQIQGSGSGSSASSTILSFCGSQGIRLLTVVKPFLIIWIASRQRISCQPMCSNARFKVWC
jgi:hypothetical protein